MKQKEINKPSLAISHFKANHLSGSFLNETLQHGLLPQLKNIQNPGQVGKDKGIRRLVKGLFVNNAVSLDRLSRDQLVDLQKTLTEVRQELKRLCNGEMDDIYPHIDTAIQRTGAALMGQEIEQQYRQAS